MRQLIRKRFAVGFVIAASAVFSMGCGEDKEVAAPSADQSQVTRASENAGTEATPLSRRQFAIAAQTICQQALTGVQDLTGRYLQPGQITLQEAQGFAREASVVLRAATADLGQLVPPKNEQKRVSALLAAAKEDTATLEQAAADSTHAQELIHGRQYFTKTRSLARRLRLFACAEISSG